MRLALALALALLAAGCGSSPPPAAPLSNARPPGVAPHEPLATIERTACFGWCPVYKVTVYRDGAVEYDGVQFVKTRGHATGSLAPDQLASLDALFQRYHYLELHDAYEAYTVTDMPSANTSYAPEGRSVKAVKHYLGDDSAPRGLTEIENGIDRIIRIEQWIGTDDERRSALHE